MDRAGQVNIDVRAGTWSLCRESIQLFPTWTEFTAVNCKVKDRLLLIKDRKKKINIV